MTNFFLTDPFIKEKLKSCYFFYGVEKYLGDEFLERLKKNVFDSSENNLNIEKFIIGEHTWPDIIDLARTIPLLFSASRIIVVEFLQGKKVSRSASKKHLSELDKSLLKEYLNSPSQGTVLVIILSEKLRESSAVVKFFSGFSPDKVVVNEMRPFQPAELIQWMDKKAVKSNKAITNQAKQRLMDSIGKDLALMSIELEKIFTFIGEKKRVEIEDIDQVTALMKTSVEWELTESLAQMDLQSFIWILNNLIQKEGISPVYILGIIANFFRNIFLAKLKIDDPNSDKKVIFKEFYPQIQEKFTQLFNRKFKQFFDLVDSIEWKDLEDIFSALHQIDLKIKSTGLAPSVLLEGFIYDYSRMREGLGRKVI